MELRDNQKRAKQTIVFFYIFLALLMLTIVATYSELVFEYLLNLAEKNYPVIIVIGFSYLACIILFIRWFHRAYYNLHQLRLEFNVKCSYEPSWAVFAWFVPIIGFFRPYTIMKEIWIGMQKKANVTQIKSRMILRIWWLAFTGRFLLILIERYTNDVFTIYYSDEINNGLNIISLVLIIYIIKAIAHWEDIIYNGKIEMAIEDHLLNEN